MNTTAESVALSDGWMESIALGMNKTTESAALSDGWIVSIALGGLLIVISISCLVVQICCCAKIVRQSKQLRGLMYGQGVVEPATSTQSEENGGDSNYNNINYKAGPEIAAGQCKTECVEQRSGDVSNTDELDSAPFYDEVIRSNTNPLKQDQVKLPEVIRRNTNPVMLDQTKQQSPHNYAVVEPDTIYWEPPNCIGELRRTITQNKNYTNISEKSIRLHEKLGRGEFGDVFRAEVTTRAIRSSVAVKVLANSSNDNETKVKLLKEAVVMGQFNHPNVVKFNGLVDTPNKMMLVMEYLSGGDLREHLNTEHHLLQKHPEKLLQYCRDVATAMEYLSEKCFIHRDLAARNILLNRQCQCKIGDFGLSRALAEETYYQTKGGRIPIRWTAPEAIFYKKYTTKSDVWSYGMVMYEIWSLGHKPFEDSDVKEVVATLEKYKGYCLSPPPGCPRMIYTIMTQSWHPDHHQRPTFSEVAESLQRDNCQLLQLGTEENVATPKALVLGEDLKQGVELYRDLQFIYKGQY